MGDPSRASPVNCDAVTTDSDITGTPSLLGAVVILPTYNEVGNIRATLLGLMDCDPLLHVLVVDDASPDGTAALAETVATEHSGRIQLLHRDRKGGLGSAYRAGFAWAMERNYQVIVQMDADGSHPVTRLPRMLGLIDGGDADVVVGSRYVPGGATRNWPVRRRLLSRIANFYARTVLKLDQRDLTSGFRVWRHEALALIDPCARSTSGYGFLVELTATAHQRGLRIVEVPITFVDRVHGRSKMNTAIALEAILMVWRMQRAGVIVVEAPEPALAVIVP